MGNTDISVNTLPDANTENTTEHSTIFDDVFRTIAQKMPQLLILNILVRQSRLSGFIRATVPVIREPSEMLCRERLFT
ncbi:MAG: hypothetical protein MR663_10165 [Lachnospiraceae bacterium]|nr:hypothetical protein [Lachnospiraceae bacterium]